MKVKKYIYLFDILYHKNNILSNKKKLNETRKRNTLNNINIKLNYIEQNENGYFKSNQIISCRMEID